MNLVLNSWAEPFFFSLIFLRVCTFLALLAGLTELRAEVESTLRLLTVFFFEMAFERSLFSDKDSEESALVFSVTRVFAADLRLN